MCDIIQIYAMFVETPSTVLGKFKFKSNLLKNIHMWMAEVNIHAYIIQQVVGKNVMACAILGNVIWMQLATVCQ